MWRVWLRLLQVVELVSERLFRAVIRRPVKLTVSLSFALLFQRDARCTLYLAIGFVKVLGL